MSAPQRTPGTTAVSCRLHRLINKVACYTVVDNEGRLAMFRPNANDSSEQRAALARAAAASLFCCSQYISCCRLFRSEGVFELPPTSRVGPNHLGLRCVRNPKDKRSPPYGKPPGIWKNYWRGTSPLLPKLRETYVCHETTRTRLQSPVSQL